MSEEEFLAAQTSQGLAMVRLEMARRELASLPPRVSVITAITLHEEVTEAAGAVKVATDRMLEYLHGLR